MTDWLTAYVRWSCVSLAYVMQEYRQSRTWVAASSSMCCWSSLLQWVLRVQLHSVKRHGVRERDIWTKTWYFLDVVILVTSCWIHRWTVYYSLHSVGWRYSDGGRKKSTTSSPLRGSVLLFSFHPSWVKVVQHRYSTYISAIRRRHSVRRKFLNSTRRQNFVVLLVVARSRSMRHYCS